MPSRTPKAPQRPRKQRADVHHPAPARRRPQVGQPPVPSQSTIPAPQRPEDAPVHPEGAEAHPPAGDAPKASPGAAPPLVGRVLSTALRTLADRWGKVGIVGGERGDAILMIVHVLAALVAYLEIWHTPEGAELRRLGMAFGNAAARLRWKTPASILPDEVPAAELAAALDRPGAVVVSIIEGSGPSPMFWGAERYRSGCRLAAATWHPDPRVMSDRLTVAVNRALVEPIVAPPTIEALGAELRGIITKDLPDDGPTIEWFTKHALRRPADTGRAILARLAADFIEHEGKGRPAMVKALLAFREKIGASPMGDVEKPREAHPVTLDARDVDALRTQLADLAGAAADQVRPLGRRRLGRVTAKRTIREAYGKATAILASAGEEASHA